MNSTRVISGLFLAGCVFLAIRCSGPTKITGNSSQTPNAVVGILYQPDGITPAIGVKVHIRPKASLADTSGLTKRLATLAATDSVVTDNAGRYAFDTTIDTGTYVIEAASGNNAVLIDSVAVKNKAATDSLPPDTLKPAGALKGVIRLSEGGDPRKVFILAFGIDRFARVNVDGSFKFQGLAEAAYDLRLISSLDNYGVLDTVGVPVKSADTTDLDTISLPFTGIPTPKNVKIAYDTLKQIITLTWTKADTALVKSYNVYRRNVDSNTVAVRINASPVADTVYRDSTGVQDQTYEYCVAAVNKSATEGTLSAAVSLKVSGSFVLIDSLNLGYGTGNSDIIYNGDSLLAVRTIDKITVLDTALRILSTFDLPTNFGNGTGHTIDHLNRIWASNYNTGQVNIYSLNGTSVDSIKDNAINYPTIIRENSSGNIFINSSIGTYVNEIRIYNGSGKFVSLFPNDTNPLKTNVDDMLFDKSGNLTILNRVDSTITIYDQTGTVIKQGKLNSYTVELELLSNGYYIVKQNGNAGVINVLNADFRLVSVYGANLGIDYRDFGTIAIDSFDRMFLRRGNQVLVYKIFN
jgi:hypothetical protein